MVTDEQNARNLKTAIRNVSAVLAVDPANMDYVQRAAYNKALADEILRYPQSFTDGTLTTARTVAGKVYAPLEDPSFDWGQFVDAAAAEAKITLPEIGKNLLIGVVVIAAVYVGVSAWRRGAVNLPALTKALP